MKTNSERGGKKIRGYGGGGGMHKHATSGVAHNHAVSIARVREYNKEQEELAELRKKQKGQTFGSVTEAFTKLTGRRKS